ncbi:hypothetical protein FOMPIDRAFT_1020089 [Fomitopsis schrenkii]|uniref:Uncharacterized protein n=1 Tax=Fomitopsis schrenkii TaxID=2126942 RepID=S8DT13_FOMSC|nr:hypothetical protein FOMPIDRAFT_1020089 [Fomitopsis schrenkii]
MCDSTWALSAAAAADGEQAMQPFMVTLGLEQQKDRPISRRGIMKVVVFNIHNDEHPSPLFLSSLDLRQDEVVGVALQTPDTFHPAVRDYLALTRLQVLPPLSLLINNATVVVCTVMSDFKATARKISKFYPATIAPNAYLISVYVTFVHNWCTVCYSYWRVSQKPRFGGISSLQQSLKASCSYFYSIPAYISAHMVHLFCSTFVSVVYQHAVSTFEDCSSYRVSKSCSAFDTVHRTCGSSCESGRPAFVTAEASCSAILEDILAAELPLMESATSMFVSADLVLRKIRQAMLLVRNTFGIDHMMVLGPERVQTSAESDLSASVAEKSVGHCQKHQRVADKGSNNGGRSVWFQARVQAIRCWTNRSGSYAKRERK